MAFFPLLSLLLLSLLPPARCSCEHHLHLLSLAFSSVPNFRPPPAPPAAGDCLRHLLLPSQNLSGPLSWIFLRNITTLQSLDLSGNALEGSVPGAFWSSPLLSDVNLAGNILGGELRFDRSALRSLNLSGNRFTAATGLSHLRELRVLDISNNKLHFVPPDMKSLPKIEFLDVSGNAMAGEFPAAFPAVSRLTFLNVSRNNLTGEVDSGALEKFGSSAFAKGGIFIFNRAARGSGGEGKRKKEGALRKGVVAGASAAAAGVLVVGLVIAGVFCCRRKRSPEKERGRGAEEGGWVKDAKWGASVVMFEKPLMELKFADLAAATAGFGRESLMAEGGRNGRVFRAVLPGEMHVVVRVVESGQAVDEVAAAAVFREVSRLRHPNLLPLLGYCISGIIDRKFKV